MYNAKAIEKPKKRNAYEVTSPKNNIPRAHNFPFKGIKFSKLGHSIAGFLLL